MAEADDCALPHGEPWALKLRRESLHKAGVELDQKAAKPERCIVEIISFFRQTLIEDRPEYLGPPAGH